MGRPDWLFCRSHGAIAGANLMEHQSGKETVRPDELGTCGVGRLACQRFLYPATDWLATVGRLGLQSGVDAEKAFRMTVKKTLTSLQR